MLVGRGRIGLAAAVSCAATMLVLHASAQDQFLPILLAGVSGQETHQSVIVLTNAGSTAARCTLDLFRSDGSRWPVLANEQPATGPLFLDVSAQSSSRTGITSASALQAGWARIRCPQRWPVTSHGIIRRIRDGQLFGEAAVAAPPNILAANLIHDPAFEAQASIAVVNPNSTPNRITLSFGQEGDGIQITLRPNEGLMTAAADLLRSSGAGRESTNVRLASQLPIVAGGLLRYAETLTDLEIHSTAVERYGFEDGTAQGWLPDHTPGNDGIRRCFVISMAPVAGTASLACEIDLDCTIPTRRNGEVSVSPGTNPPDSSTTAPANFEAATVRALLDVPAGMSGGVGFQLFVKDLAFRSFYSDFRVLEQLGGRPLEVAPGQSVRPGGFIASGFDATMIGAVGIKIGCSGGSASRVSGQIRIDSISW